MSFVAIDDILGGYFRCFRPMGTVWVETDEYVVLVDNFDVARLEKCESSEGGRSGDFGINSFSEE